MDSENGSGNTRNELVYVPFGPHPTDQVPLPWAARMLIRLKERNQKLFGELLQEAAGVDIKPRGRRAE